LFNTIDCEAKKRLIDGVVYYDAHAQSDIVKDGVREDSWGLSQFFLPAGNKTKNGEVMTKEMAQDPHIALDTMAWYFSEGFATKWSCYRKLYPERRV